MGFAQTRVSAPERKCGETHPNHPNLSWCGHIGGWVDMSLDWRLGFFPPGTTNEMDFQMYGRWSCPSVPTRGTDADS